MSAELDYTCSFRDSNAEIFNIIKLGCYKHDKSSMHEILSDRSVKSKLQKILDYYSAPNESSKKKLESNALKFGGTHSLTSMLKTFLLHLSQKLDLDEELTFRLVELFFITHPHLYEKVKNNENEEVRRELSSIAKPVIALYYSERIYLVKAVIALVLGTMNENNPCQDEFMEYLEELFGSSKLIDVAWKQYEKICDKELPSSMYNPSGREEWYMQVLEEQKKLLELLIFCNYTEAHPTAENYLAYLDKYMKQGFKGSLKVLEKDMQIPAYRQQQEKIIQEIGDLCLFHLLSSVKLDIFNERGAIPEFNPNKNPYNLVSDREYSMKIHKYFLMLADNTEFLDTEHLGPVLISWITLLIWAKGLPSEIVLVSSMDLAPLENLASHFYLFDFLQTLTKRSPFTSSSVEFSCALKYILNSLISKIHSALSVENAKNYSLLVRTTCACLESIGSYGTLKHFWGVDYPNRNGLYLMLDLLSKKYPNGGEDFLKFVCVLIGDNNCNFAQQIVEYLTNLQYFTVCVDKDCIKEFGEGRAECAYELSNAQIVIPKGTEVISWETVQRNQCVVTWKIRFSLWPVLFNYWETNLQRLKQGHSLADSELRMFSEYLDILCKLIILEPELSSILEENGLRHPANNPLEVKVTIRKPETPNLVITTYLLETFIELSRMHSPSLNTLSSILEAIKYIYVSESSNIENNPVQKAFRQVLLDRHGYGGLNTPHPLFLSLSKLRVSEKSMENFSVTYSMLELCISIFSKDTCMRVFPLSSSILSESLKYCLSEILPEIFTMTGLYKWRNTSLLLQLIFTLLDKCSQFLSNSSIPCAFIELITSQLNKVAVAGLVETVLHVVVQQSEFNEVSFWNIHWSQSEDNEETALIRAVIADGLKVLQKLLDIVLYVCENGPISITLQAASDIYRIIFTNSAGEELPLVSALLSYVPFYIERSMPEDTDDLNLASLSLQCLSNIVLIWNKSSQKNSLDYYVTGAFQELRKKFYWSFEECMTEKNLGVSQIINHSICVSYLEFLIVAIPSQKNFVSGMLSAVQILDDVKKHFLYLKNLGKEQIYHQPLVYFCLLLNFIERIVTENKKYKGVADRILQDSQLLASASETLLVMLSTKKTTVGYELCAVIQSFSCIFRILTLFIQLSPQKNRPDFVETVFNLDFLKNALMLIGKPYSNESSVLRVKDLESQAAQYGLILSINDFIVQQSYSEPIWKLFECNSNQYGSNLKYNYLRLQILLSSLDFPLDLISNNIKAFKVINLELSIVDSQFVALNSFKILLAYATSFGFSGKPNSALHLDTPKTQSNPLMLSRQTALNENIQEIQGFVLLIIEFSWASIRTESNFIHPDVISCLNKKFEILFYCYSYIIHIQGVDNVGKSEEKENSKNKFMYLSKKILAEFVDFLATLKTPTLEILSFVHILLSFYAKTCGFETKPEDSLYALVPSLGKFIQHDSEFFPLSVSSLEYALSLSKCDEYIHIFKQLHCNRVIIEKLADEKCSELECLSILKYLVSFCKTPAASKYLISLRLFPNLLQNKNFVQFVPEYEGRRRSSGHVLWCWVLTLMNQIIEVLGNDQISVSQILAFLSQFNERLTNIFEFNFVKDGKNGQVLAQKQFSLAYLEELELALTLLNKLVDCLGSLKKADKDKVEYWVSVVSKHCCRIFNINTDYLHCFPPITDHEVKNSSSFSESKLNLEVFREEKPRRSIFDPVGRTPPETQSKKNTKTSIFLYKVQIMLNYILENILSTIINYFQSSKTLPSTDLNNLVGASKFLLSNYSLVSNNVSTYQTIDKYAAEEYRDPEFTSSIGGLSFRYEVDYKAFLALCKKNFEMIFYLIMKFDLNKAPDIKNSCFGLLTDWVKLTDQNHARGEQKDPYLAYILDQISTY